MILSIFKDKKKVRQKIKEFRIAAAFYMVSAWIGGHQRTPYLQMEAKLKSYMDG
jgi:hypothetical protein